MFEGDNFDFTKLFQVDSNGFSWRSGAKVERQLRKQWFLRITAFKEALLNDLNFLSRNDRWPAQVLSMQKNWLGRSQGARITFGLTQKQQSLSNKSIQVFTTRPDTLHGVQYLALSITHPVVKVFASQQPALLAFIASVPSLPADSKAGFLLPGITASSPLSGVNNPGKHNSEIPVFAAPYVLDYGEKAVMGVPGHDSRDLAFWRANCRDKNVWRVIEPAGPARAGDVDVVPITHAFEDMGVLASTCGNYAGLPSDEASKRMISDLGDLAGKSETWKIRDWLISRQRYWGTPIPVIHCPECGPQPVPMDQLPVALPTMVRDAPSGIIGENDQGWLNTECPACGCQATRESDTMDTFMDSSWYFMRFTDPKNKHWLLSKKAANLHLPVDIYVGGVEHAILHLLYARFISKFLTTTKAWPAGGEKANRGEPFRQVISQGMVHGKTFTDPQTGRFLKPEELDLGNRFDPKIIATGETPNISWEKMSKSKHNGVDPISCVSKYGADVTRAHMLFQAPVSQVLEWDEERIVGIERWFNRIWRYLPKPQEAAAFETARFIKRESELHPGHNKVKHTDDWAAIESYFEWWIKKDDHWFTDHELKIWLQVQKTIKSVTASLSDTFALNTVISDLMELSNVLIAPTRYRPKWQLEYQSWSVFLRLLAPIAPAFAEECWERVHALCKSVATPKISIFHERWPEEDGTLEVLLNRGQTCSVQENGKFRFAIEIEQPPEGLHEASDLQGLKIWAVEQIKRTEPGKKFLEGKVFDAMHVARKGKTVNFVSPKAPAVEDRPGRDDAWA